MVDFWMLLCPWTFFLASVLKVHTNATEDDVLKCVMSGYPNRDSTIYSELYGINSAHTILRGTLRYKGYTDSIRGLVKLGLLNSNPDPVLHEKGPDLTWRQYMCHVCNQSDSLFYDNLRDILMDRLESEKIITTIENLGLISEQPIKKKGTPIDTVL